MKQAPFLLKSVAKTNLHTRSGSLATFAKGYSKTSLFSPAINSYSFVRAFSDDSGFHDDFKSIKKQYQGKEDSKDDVNDFIKKEIDSHPVVVFMKGVPEQPQCGFSRNMIAYLRIEGVKDIRGINVLTDPVLREAIKVYSQWPTLPQLYINKEFIGGENVTKEMFDSGELEKKLKAAGIELSPQP